MPKIKSPTEVADKSGLHCLAKADRPLSDEEEKAEENAVSFTRKIYKRIPPIPGTLAFMLRNIKGGNESVVEFLRWARVGERGNRTRFIDSFIILWDNMDEFSRRRVDIFDHLCRKYDIPYKKFWGVLQEGMFDHNDQITQTALSGHKPQFVERLMQLADKEKNQADRQLLANAMKLTKDGPVIHIEDKSSHISNTQNNFIPSFSQSIKRSEENIVHTEFEEVPKLRELTEGEQNYIEAEIEEDNKELEFIKAAREL